MVKIWILRVGADEQPDGRGGVMALFDGVALGGEFGQKRAEDCWRGRCIVVFLAEIEIEPDPFVVARTVGLGHPGSVESSLETSD